MKIHAFDQAIALTPQEDGALAGATSSAYANTVGPYGGITTAQLLQAVMLHPRLLGEPVSLTVNFCAAVADGPFVVSAVPARTNRSTQHWMIEMEQEGQIVMTATALTAVRRETWGVDEEAMPLCPPPQECPLPEVKLPLPFFSCYEVRAVAGMIPAEWDGGGHSSLTQLWARDDPPRPLDYVALSALADIFFPRVFIRRATLVPVGTVSMTVYFHASAKQLADTGTGYLLGQARAQAFRNGFFDQTAQLWNEAGVLLATTHQIVYYKN